MNQTVSRVLPVEMSLFSKNYLASDQGKSIIHSVSKPRFMIKGSLTNTKFSGVRRLVMAGMIRMNKKNGV